MRVIDLIANLDMTAFHSLGDCDKMLKRLEVCLSTFPSDLYSLPISLSVCLLNVMVRVFREQVSYMYFVMAVGFKSVKL